MTIEEIRKNKPKGSTHYVECSGEVLYFKHTKGTPWLEIFHTGDFVICLLFTLSQVKPL